MNCSEFTRWLDAPIEGPRGGRAREHASRCERCAALLRAQDEIDSAWLRQPAAPPLDRARFVERVMERVSAAPRPAPIPLAPPLPWWTRAAADPAAVLACALMALLLWRPAAPSQLARYLSDRWSLLNGTAIAQAQTLLGLDRPGVALGYGLLGLSLLAWVSFHLYRWTERVTRRSARA